MDYVGEPDEGLRPIVSKTRSRSDASQAVSYAALVIALLALALAVLAAGFGGSAFNSVQMHAPVPVPAPAPSSGGGLPTRVGFNAYLNKNILLPFGTATQIVNWLADENLYPGFYTTANFNPLAGTYTAPMTAVYAISHTVAIISDPYGGGGGTTFNVYCGIYINGNQATQVVGAEVLVAPAYAYFSVVATTYT